MYERNIIYTQWQIYLSGLIWLKLSRTRFIWLPSPWLSVGESPSTNNTIFAISWTSSRWVLFSLPSFNLTVRTTPCLLSNVSILGATGQWFQWVSVFSSTMSPFLKASSSNFASFSLLQCSQELFAPSQPKLICNMLNSSPTLSTVNISRWKACRGWYYYYRFHGQ